MPETLFASLLPALLILAARMLCMAPAPVPKYLEKKVRRDWGAPGLTFSEARGLCGVIVKPDHWCCDSRLIPQLYPHHEPQDHEHALDRIIDGRYAVVWTVEARLLLCPLLRMAVRWSGRG